MISVTVVARGTLQVKGIPVEALERIQNVVQSKLSVYDREDPFPEEPDKIPDELLKDFVEFYSDLDRTPFVVPLEIRVF